MDNFRSACTSDNKGISFYPTVTHGLMKCRCLDASSLRTVAFVFILHLGGYWTINGLDRAMDCTGRPDRSPLHLGRIDSCDENGK